MGGYSVFLDINSKIILLSRDSIHSIEYYENTTEILTALGKAYYVKGPFHPGETFKEALQHVVGIRNGLKEMDEMQDALKHCVECKKLLGDSFVEVKDKGRMCKACFDHEQEDLKNQAGTKGEESKS